jgi:hypothetical protein
MLNPNELRLGNYVNYEQTSHIISELGKGLVAHYWHKRTNDEEYVSRYEELKPIELTAEILEKCGFEKEDFFGYSHPHLKCRWITSDFGDVILDRPFLRFDSIGRPPYICTDVYFLHQLQNLYFALTGEELIISNL